METATTAFDEKKLPGELNVLTILTIIGCVIGLLFSIYGYIKADENVTNMATQLNNPDLPALAKKFITQDALDNARIMAANKLPLVILGTIGIALCFFGAIQMRQRKLNGYYLWLTGEILPFLGSIIFINMASVYKGTGQIIGLVIITIFIALYTMQKKYLTVK